MVDRRHHRGPDPHDEQLFGSNGHSLLREAVADASWLLSRGYSEHACVTLVGDRYRLHRRQRLAVRRMACSDDALEARRRKRLPMQRDTIPSLVIDGFNILVTFECAMGGAVVLKGRDGSLRDLAGLRGTYRIVHETEPAVRLLGQCMCEAGVRSVTWILDRPVSNSGRLASRLRALAAEHGWDWDVYLEDDADSAVLSAGVPVATADSAVIDRCSAWVALGDEIIPQALPDAWIVGD